MLALINQLRRFYLPVYGAQQLAPFVVQRSMNPSIMTDSRIVTSMPVVKEACASERTWFSSTAPKPEP